MQDRIDQLAKICQQQNDKFIATEADTGGL